MAPSAPSPAALDERLLDAGRRAFASHGFHGATLERIAREAGLSRVTLHRRGVTREGILAALAERATDEYRAALWPALTGSGNGRQRLGEALRALCQMAERNLELLLALRAQADAVFHEPGEDALTRSVYTEPLERLLRDGAGDGSLREVDAVEYATLLFNLVGWTYVHLRTGHRWSAKRAARTTIDLALNGLQPPAG